MNDYNSTQSKYKSTMGIIPIVKVILFLVLPWNVTARGRPGLRTTRYRKWSGEMCVDVNKGVGEVTVRVSDKYYWFCNHLGASCNPCKVSVQRIPHWGRGNSRMCREIHGKFYEVSAPTVARDWLLGIGFAEGNCVNMRGK